MFFKHALKLLWQVVNCNFDIKTHCMPFVKLQCLILQGKA